MLKKLFYLLYKLWIGLVFWGTLFLLYPLFWFLLKRKKYVSVFRWKRRWGHMIRVLMFCPLKIEWEGKLPEPPFVAVSNHSSYIDTAFFYCVIPEFFLFIGKEELLKWPLFQLFFKEMDIPVSRANARDAVRSLRKASDALKRGESIAIYPEGTIPWETPKMLPFRQGAFKLAIENQVPIVPVTWLNNYKIMGLPEHIWSQSAPRTIRVVVHEPIMPSDYQGKDLTQLSDAVYDVISHTLEEHIATAD